MARNDDIYDGARPEDLPVCSWDQVDGIVRQIGELANKVKAVRMDSNKRILDVKRLADREIENLQKREMTLYNWLKLFADAKLGQDIVITKQFAHGKVAIIGRDIQVEPKLEYIEERKGKP